MCVCENIYIYCVIVSVTITLKKESLKIACGTCSTKKDTKADSKVFRHTANIQHFH